MRIASLLALAHVCLLAQTGYQKAPPEVRKVLDTPATPVLTVSPAHTHVLFAEPLRYPPIAELSQPMLRLAGIRINPLTNSEFNSPHFVRLALKDLKTGAETALSLPSGGKPGMPRWNRSGSAFALTITQDSATELWLGSPAGKLRRIEGARLNGVLGLPFAWMDDGQTLLVRLVPKGRGDEPAAPRVPAGPHVQESSGRAGPVRTYEDMLSSAHDEDLFDYYATTQLALVDAHSGAVTPIGKPAIYSSVEPSPDGKHLLTVRLKRPYSYLHPFENFPKDVEVLDRAGAREFLVASLGLEDRVPIEGVPVGPRAYHWRPSAQASLMWVEAMDGGNPKEKAKYRDRILTLAAPFKSEPAEAVKLEQRYMGLAMAEKSGVALVSDYERQKRWMRTFRINLDNPSEAPELLFSRSVQDRYSDPGAPVTKEGRRSGAMVMSGDFILLRGAGASPAGDRPFLDRYNVTSKKAERLFQCDKESYESVEALLDDEGTRFITRRESPAEPPNYFMRTAAGDSKPLTAIKDPAPELRQIEKRLVMYKRPDGVPLSFTLYLPPGYKPGTPLPTVVWAYPREYNDAATAGQVSGSTRRFTTITGMSHLFFLLRGYAILDDAAMPVVGDPETANNTYVEQIVAGARAAIDKAVELGVTDPQRVGVGGHSYGAFMTANLLANCDLFKAGIARSGAYNRTLTPFGFQSERRTLWEAADIYLRMSPFLIANKIHRPILFIHGEADDNTGTFPIQSERMYQAVRGNGGTTRLVMLPNEAHGYRARESIEHTLWEMFNWFDRYVKGETPKPAGD